MKKIVFASVMALASLSLVIAPTLRAQESGTIQIKDPAEFNAYQMAITQSDPAAKAAALESFLQTYPQSVVKQAVLDMLVDTYQQLRDPDKTLSAASRLLQVDPNNMKAIYISVFIKKSQCAKSVNATGKASDPQPCDDAAALATKGLAVPKPAGVSDDDWKKQTAATYPLFHSAIALDDDVSKEDYKGAIAEYTASLNLMSEDQSKVGRAGGHAATRGCLHKACGEGSAEGDLVLRAGLGFCSAGLQGADRAQAGVLLQEIPRRPGRTERHQDPGSGYDISSRDLHDRSCEESGRADSRFARVDAGFEHAGSGRQGNGACSWQPGRCGQAVGASEGQSSRRFREL